MGLTRQTAIGSGVKLFVRRYRLQSGNLAKASRLKLEPWIQRWDWGYKPL